MGAANSRFARGSGVYTCRVCEIKTRSTGRGDNEGIRLCAECNDLCQLENALLDGGAIVKQDPINAAAWIATIQGKGGNVSHYDGLVDELKAKIELDKATILAGGAA